MKPNSWRTVSHRNEATTTANSDHFVTSAVLATTAIALHTSLGPCSSKFRMQYIRAVFLS